jgi:hypothetical protein
VYACVFELTLEASPKEGFDREVSRRVERAARFVADSYILSILQMLSRSCLIFSIDRLLSSGHEDLDILLASESECGIEYELVGTYSMVYLGSYPKTSHRCSSSCKHQSPNI